MNRFIPWWTIFGVWFVALGWPSALGANAAGDVPGAIPAPVIEPAAVQVLGKLTTVPDRHLVGTWRGRNRFFGLRQEEISSGSVEAKFVEVTLTIEADGRVTGQIGGATLRECTIRANRGRLGRLLHVKTDFIICGKLVGSVAPLSEGGSHVINAPVNLDGGRMTGSVFVLRGGFSNPYPFLKLQLDRSTAMKAGAFRG
ncbi:MAG: hypothetical protein ACHQ4G_10745 [Opitutales bacterium]